jgi:hypothetical protein
MKHPIPLEALDDRLAFVGTSGSGKTYGAKGRVERLLSSAARCAVVDANRAAAIARWDNLEKEISA